VLFETDKAVIPPSATRELAHIATTLRANAALSLEIHGFTDAQGSDDYNIALSEQCSRAVAAELMRMGISASRLTTRGFGKDTRTKNDTDARRVEFRFVDR
jgi:OmpA-OmpF porin, OOP family